MKRVRHRILAGVTYAALEKMSVQALSVTSFLVVISQLSLKDFGLFNLLFTFVSVGTTIVTLGIDRLVVADAAVYRAKEAVPHMGKLFREFGLLNVVLLIILFFGSWFLQDIAKHFYTINFTLFYWILVFLIIGQAGMNYASVVLEAVESFGASFAVKLSESIVRTVLIFSLFFWLNFSIVNILWAYVIAKICATLISFYFVAPHLMKKGGETKNLMLSEIFRKHGKWESALTLFQTVTSNAIPWIVNHLISTEAVALFAFVQKVNSVFIRALPVRSAIFPILTHSVEKSRSLASVIITKARKYLFIVYVLVYVITCASTGLLLPHFLPQYQAAAGLIYLSMLKLFIDAFTLGQSPVFYALKLQKITFTLSIYVTISTLLLQTAFTWLFGLTGLVLSVLIISSAIAIVREYILYHKYHFPLMNWRELLVFDKYDKLLLTQAKRRLLRR